MTKDINIANTLLRERKEKGITQDELAQYIGVSKASVSKWETGASYPDIAFLPQLATYFDISIDELMGYNPQMSEANIRKLRQRLTASVTERPFEETLEESRGIIKKYYSCYPLLMQMGLFLINNVSLAKDPAQTQSLLSEITTLFVRIREESSDINLAQDALRMEAYCYLAAQNPDAALALLEDSLKDSDIPADLLAAFAYQMKGEMSNAKKTVQIGLYQNLVLQMNYLINYVSLVTDDTDAFKETVRRAQAVSSAYEFAQLHPYLQISLDLMCAVGYATRGETDECIDSLERCVKVLTSEGSSINLHGDEYFNLIDDWIENLESGDQLPRNTVLAKKDLIDAVVQHPAFASLAHESRYQDVVARMERLGNQ